MGPLLKSPDGMSSLLSKLHSALDDPPPNRYTGHNLAAIFNYLSFPLKGM